MKAVHHTDVAAFWQLAGPLFEADPLRHTIALTVFRGLMTAPDPKAEPPVLLTFEHDGDTVGAAFCTPPWPLGVSAVPDEAVPELLNWLRHNDYTPIGVSGPRDRAEPFAEAWSAGTGGTKELAIALRLYRLGELSIPETPGEPRLASDDDIPLLGAWREAFMADTGTVRSDPRPDQHEDTVRRLLAIGNAQYLWEVYGEPVAHAAASVPVNGMSRIGPVYTPPEHRNHGYGTAVTAVTAQWALDAGAEHVVLFTDLANPTTNSIYQKIGFAPVYDGVEYRFTGPAGRD